MVTGRKQKNHNSLSIKWMALSCGNFTIINVGMRAKVKIVSTLRRIDRNTGHPKHPSQDAGFISPTNRLIMIYLIR
jgi:hypothetical protein